MTQNSASSANRSIQIGGNVSGATIVSGNNNTVTNQSSTVASSSSSAEPEKRKLLLLAANPQDSTRARLDEEVRDISEGLQRSRHRDSFEITQRWAVRPRDFQRAMLEELPQIVHFSGHSKGDTGLYFENDLCQSAPVSSAALASLFQLFAKRARIECVVLNGCYSQAQAEAIVVHVPFVVGVPSAASAPPEKDTCRRAAIEFAVGFYDALGSGEPIDFAFESGKVSMALSGVGSEDTPLLLTQSA
ncbi:MAG: CHAT domain-containing protein [Phormidesmis sp.]